jgi:pyruvate formate lyase activating enzyme
MNSGVPYEFRATILPRIHSNGEFKNLVKSIKGCSKFYIQNFRPNGSCLNKEYEYEKSFSKYQLQELQKEARKTIGNCEVRS